MTAEELIRVMLDRNPYLMREHLSSIRNPYAMDPADRSYAFAIIDMVQVGLGFTEAEALDYIRIVTATV